MTTNTNTVAVARANAGIFATLAKSLTSAANKATTAVGLTKAQSGGKITKQFGRNKKPGRKPMKKSPGRKRKVGRPKK